MRLMIGVFALLLSGTAFAHTLHVTVAVHGDVAAKRQGRFVCVPVASPAGESDIAVRAVAVPGAVVIDVNDSLPCKLELDVEGLWHRPLYVQKGQEASSVDLWPVAVLTGALQSAQPRPAELQLRFLPVNDQDTDMPGGGEVTCPVVDGRFRCVLPAGQHHLRLRATRKIPHYRWNVALAPHETRDLGTLTLRDGASIAGSVEVRPPSKVRSWRDIKVAAIPAGVAEAHANESALIATPDDHGWFLIEGVPPGEYLISAASGDLSSERVRIRVLPQAQPELTAPLVLDTPKALELSFSPPLDPWGKPWQVRLSRLDGGRGTVVTASSANDQGVWSARRLRSGAYELEVGTGTRAVWHRSTITIAASDVTMALPLPGKTVRGTVTLGGRPAADVDVLLGGKYGAIRQKATTDSEGTFSTYAPEALAHEGKWTIDVTGAQPSMHRRIELTPEVDDAGDLVFAIELPSRRIGGRVLHADGSPAAGALVNVEHAQSEEILQQARVDESGAFVLAGLDRGDYSLQANDFMKESRKVRVTVADEPNAPIDLVLQANDELRGSVESPYGPVPGATVLVFPRDVDWTSVAPARTSADGTFVTVLPAGTRQADVLVGAPGFAFEMARIAIEKRHLRVTVSQNGGTLRLTVPPLTVASSASLALLHNGATAGVTVLLTKWGGRIIKTEKEQVEISVPAMQPGEYSLCIQGVTIDRSACTTGYLAPQGELALSVVPPQ